jgi:hypothetical protein
LREELRDQKAVLDTLRAEYDRIAAELAGTPLLRSLLGSLRLSIGRLTAVSGGSELATETPRIPLPTLVNAIADLEYAMRRRETIQRVFAGWMVVHVSASIIMYATLTLHVWNGIYYGLRWVR